MTFYWFYSYLFYVPGNFHCFSGNWSYLQPHYEFCINYGELFFSMGKKQINKCKYTFLFLDVGVESAWGKLGNAAIKILWRKKIQNHSFVFYGL